MSKNAFSVVRNEYVQLLSESRKNLSDVPIGNLYPWHCAAAISELLTHALSEQRAKSLKDEFCTVCILTGTCPDQVYGGDSFELLKRFVAAGGKLQVLVWNRISDLSRLRELAAAYQQHVEVIEANLPSTNESPPHFFLVDASAYRYEAPHQPYESSEFHDFGPEIPARICFNDPAGGSRLKLLFGNLWKAAKARISNQKSQ